ncbi:MAG: hypothetical protein ACRC78_02995 [Planktothrix sp.]
MITLLIHYPSLPDQASYQGTIGINKNELLEKINEGLTENEAIEFFLPEEVISVGWVKGEEVIGDLVDELIPNYQQFMDILDNNGLYFELIQDKRFSMFSGVELALTIAEQAEKIYIHCLRGVEQSLGGQDIRNFQFRLTSFYHMLNASQKKRLTEALLKSNIPAVAI